MSHRIANSVALPTPCQSAADEFPRLEPMTQATLAAESNQPESQGRRQASIQAAGVAPQLYVRETEDGVQARGAAIRSQTDALDVSLLSVASRTGRQTEVAAHLSHLSGKITAGPLNLAGSTETLSAGAAAGLENADGSQGFNVRAGAVVWSAEGTAGYSGNSVTMGVSAGVSGELSVGERDADNDGKREQCIRIGALWVTLGACLEDPL